MLAIEVNGEIKQFARIPLKWEDENGVHLNIKDGSELGFKEVVVPEFDSRIERLDNLHLEGDVYTYDVVDKQIKETLSELKEQKISQLKIATSVKLSETDWYIIREYDSGEATPSNIRGERAALRSKSDSMEAEINALTTKKAVLLYEINI